MPEVAGPASSTHTIERSVDRSGRRNSVRVRSIVEWLSSFPWNVRAKWSVRKRSNRI